MNIAEIQIDQFGAWRNLTLPLNRHGLTVLHGPNEAGKTTLMRFVRGMLYGFPTRTGDRSLMAGSLRLSTAGGECRLHRAVNLHNAASSRGDIALSEAFGELQHHPSGEASNILDGALQGISEAVYEHVFAVGLREVQELSTLDDQEVARHIYGLTLGLEGQRLLNAWNGVREERRKLLDPATNTGMLADFWAECDRIQTAIRLLPDPAIRHAELARQRDNLETELASCRHRQAGVQAQLRGHVFLDRVYTPWRTARESQNELNSLPVVNSFPEDGVDRLRRIDAEAAALKQKRGQLATEAQALQKKSRQLAGTPALRKHAGAMRGFVLQRGWVGDLQSRIKETDERREICQLELESCCDRLGPGWTVSSLDSADVTTAAHHRLAGTARSFNVARLRRSAVARACRRLGATIRQQQKEIDDALLARNADSLDDALAQARRLLEDLKSLAALRLHEKELTERQAGIDAQLSRVKPRHALPGWVYAVLGAFCVAGAVLGCWGLFAGITSSEIAGLTYVLLGLTTAGVAWGIKSQFEGDARQRITELEADAERNRSELDATRKQVHQLTTSCDLSEFGEDDQPAISAAASAVLRARLPSAARTTSRADAPPADLPMLVKAFDQVRDRAQALGQQIWKSARDRMTRSPAQPSRSTGAPKELHTADGKRSRRSPGHALLDESLDESLNAGSMISRDGPQPPSPAVRSADPSFELGLLQRVAGQVADLEQLRRRQQLLQKARARLTERGRKLRSCQKEAKTVQQTWRDLLRQIGFPETLKTEEAFEHWRLLQEAKDHRRRCQEVELEQSRLGSLWTSFQHRVEELDRLVNPEHPKDEQPVEVLTRWESQLAEVARNRRERREVVKLLKARRRELAGLARQGKSLELKRNALLLQGGAGDREEFEFRAHCATRRVELESRITESRALLEAICEQYADLAIVEEDLEALDLPANQAAIATLEQELSDLEEDVTHATESLAAVRREMVLVESDRELSRLRFDREQAAERLARATEQWLALESAAKTIDQMRTHFERTCQPRVLAMASRTLHRMTGGRFTNIWTPLDRRELRIEDSRQSSFTVEQLSSGTREQLFLAVRLAIIEELGQKGTYLPVILDDVFVNFDETRAEAAAEVLLDFARQGQQVLFFTCHKHLADIFTHRGAPKVELPAREAEYETHRLAG